MPSVFLDTSYLVAFLNPDDVHYKSAVSISENISMRRGYSTYVSIPVLTEFLGFFSKYGPKLRLAASMAVKQLMNNNAVNVLHSEKSEFLEALELYSSRQDKNYSLVDCHIMCMVRRMKISGVLSFDGDFDDEGLYQIDSEKKMAALD